ncbi:hypothetical protein AB5N96_08300 [Chryseomicrobium imtechense]
MEFLSSSLYSEINCSFSISHKIDLEIRSALNKKIISELKLTSKEQEFKYINLMVTTNSTTNKVEVKGPYFNRKNEIINWELWLPFKEITSTASQEIPYLKFYFDALVMLFEKYEVEEDQIRSIQKEISEKVIGNKEYEFKEETLDYDFSDFDF